MISGSLQIEEEQQELINDDVYTLYARVLSYPDREYLQAVEECVAALESYPVAADEFARFASFVRGKRTAMLEEQFIATFDMNNKRPLEIGWHLYGQEYKRGQFLVKMRQLLRENKVEESSELPDHLSHCLRLLPAMDAEDVQSFVQKYGLPGLRGILKGFDSENAYRHVIQSLLNLLSDQFGREES